MGNRTDKDKAAMAQAMHQLAMVFPGATMEETPTDILIRIPKPKEYCEPQPQLFD